MFRYSPDNSLISQEIRFQIFDTAVIAFSSLLFYVFCHQEFWWETFQELIIIDGNFSSMHVFISDNHLGIVRMVSLETLLFVWC
jgi:hypothetical protein